MGNIEDGESKDISGNARFENRPIHRIASLRFFMVFLSYSKQDSFLLGTQLLLSGSLPIHSLLWPSLP